MTILNAKATYCVGGPLAGKYHGFGSTVEPPPGYVEDHITNSNGISQLIWRYEFVPIETLLDVLLRVYGWGTTITDGGCERPVLEPAVSKTRVPKLS